MAKYEIWGRCEESPGKAEDLKVERIECKPGPTMLCWHKALPGEITH